MRRASFEDMNCSIAQALEEIGEWWSLLIIRDAFLGVTRFDDFQERLGIARNVLNQRLSHLVDEGVFERVAYNEHPPRYDYVLTEQGRDLWPVVVALRQWGDKHVVGRGNEPIKLRHEACGSITTAHLACDACGERLSARDARVVPGPGLEDDSLIPSQR